MAKVSGLWPSQQDKLPPFQHVADVIHAGEELPVESRLSGLSWLQLLEKETQRLPDRGPLAALVQPGSDMRPQSINSQADGSSR